jgi:hypothetical protein
MKPFTYSIYCKPTNQYYYGVRYSSNCHPSQLWTSYFTSSKRVHKLIEQFGKDQFIVKVRRTFETQEQAVIWETRFLKKVNASSSNLWLNCQNGDGAFRNKGGYKLTEDQLVNFKKPKSESHKKSMRSRYNVKHSHYNDGIKSYYLPENSPLISELSLLKGQVNVVCPHCNKTGKLNAMLRWHFDKCINRKNPPS